MSTFVPPARVTAPPRLTERHPWLFPVAVRVHRARRRLSWTFSRTPYSHGRTAQPLPHRVRRHRSLLLRELSDLDGSGRYLQHGKVTNLRLAAVRVDGLVIRPGETFSFNRVVGNCTRRKGYVEGMRLSNGSARPGVGGGICQLANLLHWMFLHAPLTVEQFLEHDGRHYRRNEIWRTRIDERTGVPIGDELVKRNCALVMYLPEGGVPVARV